jgi:hypothetical protein
MEADPMHALIVDRWTEHRFQARVLVAKRRYLSRSFATREEAEAWVASVAVPARPGCMQPIPLASQRAAS